MSNSLWQQCLEFLSRELDREDIQTWLQPLQVERKRDQWQLFAPNAFVQDRVESQFLERIRDFFEHQDHPRESVVVKVGSTGDDVDTGSTAAPEGSRPVAPFRSGLDQNYRFDNFVQGKSNEMGYAAALQVAQRPGHAYNPLLLYGSTGLGKTHLLHAAGNLILEREPKAKVLYLHSERFVNDMITALRKGTINQFKKHFRSVYALLIDDIQFLAGKDRSQEEFFHTFNALLDGQQQIILTCDRYPKEVDKLEPRLRSRFGWGLTMAIEPPDFETRVAILLRKAEERGVELDQEVAFLIAKRMRSNVRDLEGALNTLLANANFTGRAIDLEFTRETLRDLLMVHDRLITIDNIQKTVANYYSLRVQELLSKRRTRAIARPRQMAMSLSKTLTDHSLPEIGDAFGGRDHTTVLHACRTIDRLVEEDGRLREDHAKLMRTLTS